MPSDVRKIDPNLNLGLHELANSGEEHGSFSFQLQFAKQQIEDILSNFDDLVRNTVEKAPVPQCERKGSGFVCQSRSMRSAE